VEHPGTPKTTLYCNLDGDAGGFFSRTTTPMIRQGTRVEKGEKAMGATVS